MVLLKASNLIFYFSILYATLTISFVYLSKAEVRFLFFMDFELSIKLMAMHLVEAIKIVNTLHIMLSNV